MLPRYAAGSVTALMWALLAVSLIAIAMIALAPIATYARGTAVVSGDGAAVVVFVAPENLPRLARGQQVRLSLDAHRVAAATVEAVDPSTLSAADAHRRFRPDDAARLAITGPAAVLTVRLTHDDDARLLAGAVVPAIVETGSESIASRLSFSHQRHGA